MFVLILIWAIALNWLAYKKRFYQIPQQAKKGVLEISHLQFLACFGIYLVISFLFARILFIFIIQFFRNINPDITTLPVAFLTGLQLLIMFAVFFSLQIFMYNSNEQIYKKIWKDKQFSSPIELDVALGVFTWFLSFPLVTILSEILDTLLKVFIGYEHTDQVAVKFVKIASGSPISLIFALISVLILAPLTEEFLFRGILLNYLKKRLGIVAAILISAFAFSLLHFSPNQGLSNISLIFSLFLLGCYLGFLYERQKSLWAPISLHVTFNAISALRILLLPEAA